MNRRLVLLALAAAFSLPAALAAQPIYDETADARAALKSAQAEAAAAKKPLLVVFGANWCGDCKMLDMAFHEGTTAPLIAQRYQVLKIDVGRFDRNVDVAESLGVPLKKGIPAVAVLNPAGRVTFATKAGELADARRMGDKGIHDFFAKLAQ